MSELTMLQIFEPHLINRRRLRSAPSGSTVRSYFAWRRQQFEQSRVRLTPRGRSTPPDDVDSEAGTFVSASIPAATARISPDGPGIDPAWCWCRVLGSFSPP